MASALILVSFRVDAQKVGMAMRTSNPVKVDALQDEADWAKAPVLTDFIQNSPVPGVAPKFQTEVRVMYDDEALYILGHMWDPQPDSIPHQLTNRDDFGNTDFFGVTLSCFRDGLNGIFFGVTPDGVQMDILMSPTSWDDAWNVVWFSKCAIHEKGWTAEFKIPYSAFRFPKKEEQEWDINFERNNRRYRETSYWNEVKPEVDGKFNQSGILRGITAITPPPRLFFFPYASGYVERAPDGNGGFSSGFQWNAGMDVKYGLTDAFTLDMTLVPDFG